MRSYRGHWHAIVFTCFLATSAAHAGGVTVRVGDSLWSISRAHGTTVDALMEANGLTSDRLRPGTTLRLPGDAIVAERADPSTFESYTIKAGDTLYDIALLHRVGVDDLIAWNDLDGTLIRPGQTLVLRQRNDAAAPPPLVVTVQSGTTLWQLARAHDTTVGAIASANGVDPNATLRLGQTLTIPGRYAAVGAVAATSTEEATVPDLGGPAPATISVGPGESLWAIARRHDTSVNALMSLNGLQNDRLQVGQTLRIVPGVDLGAARDPAFGPRPDALQGGMVWPLVGSITSRFGYRRLRIGGTNMHYGLDIDGNTGDPIRSATPGTVTFSGWRGGFGKLVIVTNGDTEYFYAHASALLVSEGETVTPGQIIAHVGSTGNVTGPHLHFEIRVDGTAIDPLPILEARATR
jgi:murein DD-endopeptidase MepM/ murein hydrolase activator NlpD